MSVTRSDILKRIEECEKKGEFDVHVDPPGYDIAIPVTESYPYIKKPLHLKIAYALDDFFIVRPFMWYKHKFVLKTTVDGREHLAGIKSAVITCNHVNMWDCLVVKKAMRGHKLYITAAWFNNMKGFLGTMMRAERMMPLSNEPAGMKKFVKSVNTLLKTDNYVLFYPEQAMWWNYEKPRPYKDGAFHFAAENNVPVIPCFITFTPTGKKDGEGISEKQFHIHILEPIYPDASLNRKQNTQRMMDTNFERCKEEYERFYHKKLSYLHED